MNILKLLACFGVTFFPMAISRLTQSNSSIASEWYYALQKPAFTPPGYIFAIVWPCLYILMAISLYLFLASKGDFKKKKKGLIYFAIQLILNASYTPVFFGEQSIIGGLIISILLALAVILTIFEFYRSSKIAAYLLVPYILWGIFAIILGGNIFILN